MTYRAEGKERALTTQKISMVVVLPWSDKLKLVSVRDAGYVSQQSSTPEKLKRSFPLTMPPWL